MDSGSVRIKLPSVDSFDEEGLSDVDDEVFIKSSKNGFRNSNKDRMLQKPLMAPRKKMKQSRGGQNQTNGTAHMEILTTTPKGSPILINILYAAIVCGALIGITGLVIFLARSHLTALLSRMNLWKSHQDAIPQLIPCDTLDQDVLWEKTFFDTILEHQNVISTTDINKDNTDDVVLGFGTGVRGITSSTAFLCQVYFNTSSPECGGGIKAMDGCNGTVLWTTWLKESVLEVHCTADLDQDGVNDCIGVGKSQGLWAVSSQDGTLLWEATTDKISPSCFIKSRFVSPEVVQDLNGDKVLDIVVGLQGQGVKCPSYIASVNGRTGTIIQLMSTADRQPISAGPLLKSSGDGSTLVMYATGSKTDINGSLFLANLEDVISMKNDMVRSLYANISRVTSIVVSDITSDGMEDFLLTLENSTIVALDGATLQLMWIYRASVGDIVKIQAVAYLNPDVQPDITVQITRVTNGSSISWVEVLDGNAGKLLMSLPGRPFHLDITGEVVNVEGPGYDIVLRWITELEEHDQVNRLMGFSSRGQLPGLIIYSTPKPRPSYYKDVSLRDVIKFLNSHVDIRKKFSHYIRQSQSDITTSPITEEIEPKLIGYPAQHGVRKHGRWNGRKNQPAYQPASFDYERHPPSPAPVSFYRPESPVWDEDTEDSVYPNLNENEYDQPNIGYEDIHDYRYERPAWRHNLNQHRRKRVRREDNTVRPILTETVTIPPLLLNTNTEAAVDVVFGTQWNFPEYSMDSISTCVSQRLDRGKYYDVLNLNSFCQRLYFLFLDSKNNNNSQTKQISFSNKRSK